MRWHTDGPEGVGGYARRRYAGHKVRRRTVHIAARPYMVPALTREKPKLPGMWADSIR